MTKKDRQEREQQNALLRAYGYHWKRYKDLTSEQESAWFHSLCDPEDFPEQPEWVLLSPLEIPVSDWAIHGWLGKRGTSSEDILAFIKEHGFTFAGKDDKHAWCIRAPDGTIINLKQTLQAIEQKRLDEAKERTHERKQKFEEDLKKSIESLKETLDLYGHAGNDKPAQGIYSVCSAERLPDGKIQIVTYHFEGEFQTNTYENEDQVVYALYTEGNGGWDPGIWTNPS